MTGTTPIDTIIQGDCLEEMGKIPDKSVDAIVTDPPYELAFMGKKWDASGIAYNVDMWGECLRVLKPGGHLLAFGGSRTYHRMACAIEDAGFEIRDSIHWCYGSGFPKSLSIERAVDKANGTLKDRGKRFNAAGVGKSNGGSEFRSDHPDYKPYEPISDAAKQWAGWGSALKPAHESIILARKPIDTDTGTYLNLKSLLDIEAQLWCLLPANVAEKNFGLSPSEHKKACDFAHMNAEQKSCTPGILSDLMDMQPSESVILFSLSTVLSWRNILEEIFYQENRCITKMAIDQTIDLKTLNYCISSLTARSIIQARIQADGGWLNVLPAARYLHAVCLNLTATQERFVAENAIRLEAQSCRAGVGEVLHEPVVLARKPLDGCTIAENVLRWGCGGLNIDATRIPGKWSTWRKEDGSINKGTNGNIYGDYDPNGRLCQEHAGGRFPANLIHDNSPAVLAEFAKAGESKSNVRSPPKADLGDFEAKQYNDYGAYRPKQYEAGHNDQGTPARFFMACEFTPADYAPMVYYAKASRSERNNGLDDMPLKDPPGSKRSAPAPGRSSALGAPRQNHHPTVKPLALMRYLCRLITPPGGTILDPFGGSGTTGIAAIKEGFHYILIEQQAEYCEIARKRIAAVPARLDRWAEVKA